MRAPVGDHAIGTIGCIAAAAVADDRMIRNTRRDWQLVDSFHESVVRLERIDAIWHPVERSGRRVGDKQRFGCSIRRSEQSRRSDERSANSPDPVRRQLAASVRSGNEYHPLNVRPMIKNERLFQEFACVARQRSFRRRRGKKISPDFITRVCDH